MTEVLTQQNPNLEHAKPGLSPESVDSWMKQADGYLDKKFTVYDNGQPKEYVLIDAVNKHVLDDSGNKTGEVLPIVLVESEDGKTSEMNTEDFLVNQGFTDEVFSETSEIASGDSQDETSETNYDDLFSDDYDKTPHSVERAQVRTPEVKREDVQSSELGLIEVIKRDSNFKLLMDKITSKFDTSSQADMLKKLREDQETSSEIKDYISLKLEQNLHKMPARIFENSDKNYKNPNYPGYENANKLTSREYAIILAESMINGSFNFDYSKSSPIFINSNNEVEVGQHRVAALYSLGFNLDDPWVQENFKIDRNNK